VSKTFFIVEASHLFRAGDKFQTQFFVLDVVNYLNRTQFGDGESSTIVLHGSVKNEQAERYAAALERHQVRVIRMRPIESMVGPDKWYFKPTWYCHKMMGTDIPKGSSIVLIGFHNPRYKSFLAKYQKDFAIHMAAFTTPSKKQGWMGIPEDFQPLLKSAINLDDHATGIKAEFKRKKK
jgi:hypothetical protein